MNKINKEHVASLESSLRNVLSEKQDGYEYSATYNIADFPLPLVPAYSSDCSEIVDAGFPLGKGRFCDYFIIGAGLTLVIWYNRFEPGSIA